ncbi:Transposon TX1 uncharacterized 149 kDa protein [Vitis vinifera]|uniref:Transposon TX1 uncharacterized 149 kDa protein n=1 Tax=Vitis vinifera TaxID=29760 RepID=A0A438GHL6_VITVI|nr:Transposon TX1 uncharacterized 149 kDa protein [Vitis vinifera]
MSEEKSLRTNSLHRWDSSDGSDDVACSGDFFPRRNPQLSRKGGSFSDLMESSPREAEASQNPLSMMLRDGSTVVLTDASGPVLENEALDLVDCDVAKQGEFSAELPCTEGWHEVEIMALLKKLKLKTGSSTLCKRRLNDIEKRKLIKGVVRNQKLDLVCLMETKVKEMSVQMVNCVGVGRFLNWASVDARGAAKGLLLFWDNRVLEKLEVESGGYSISIRFRNRDDGFTWIFSRVYGSMIGSEKEDFWEELEAICGLWEDPWCIGGDFNAIRFPEERRNAPRLTVEMRRFSEVIGDLGLRNFPLAGGPFTWIGGLNSQSAPPRLVSDHNPIVLEAGGFSSGKSPFRFENMWLKIEGFKDPVKSWWNGYFVEGYSSHCIAEKLKSWEAKENENSLIPREAEAKRYFHKMANARARRNFLSKFRVNEVSFSSNEEIKKGVCRAYQSLLSESGDWRPTLSSCCGDKALGPDGFTMAIWLKLVIGEVISDSQQAFIQGRQILDTVLIDSKALNSKLKDNTSGLLLKMDIEKAFDHVNWDFLMVVMSKMGFGHRWINWMKWCYSTATFSILINESPPRFFHSSRGLRQGDPLSPYLFLLTMEALSQLLSSARNGGFISGFKVGGRGREGLIVSHLLFVDDTLISCDTDAE